MKLLYLSAFIVMLASPVRGQDSTRIFDTLVSDIKTGVSNGISFFTAPVTFDGTEWLMASGLAAGTLLMFYFDEDLETTKPTFIDKSKPLKSVLLNYGDVDYANVFGLTMYAAGLFSEYDPLRITGRLLVESLFLSGSTALLLRVITGRPRPFTNENSSFRWFENGWNYQSFPSGHTVVVFSVSTVLAERIDNDWVRGGFYGLSGLAAVERIYSSEHWFSDVIIGALLGYGSAKFVLNKEEEKKQERQNGISVYPYPGGLSLIWRF